MTQPPDGTPLKVVVSSHSRRLVDEAPTVRAEDPDDVLPTTSPPSFAMPGNSLQPDEVPTIEELLFDLEGDLWGASVREQCAMALEVIGRLLPCEVASVVRGSLNDEFLVIEVATGPVAEHLRGRRLPFGSGIVGYCFDQKETVRVDDVQGSDYHFPGTDEETGFRAERALCVPVLDEDGLVYGVIELLNPTSKSFVDEDEEAVERVAGVLAHALAER